MDEKHVLRGLLQNPLQEPLVTFRVKSAFDALIKQTPGEIFNRPKHFVAFALAAGRHLRLPAAARPRVTQRAPLGKTRFILKEDQALTTFGSAQNRGPLVVEPGLAAGGVEMIRHKTRLLQRKPQVVQ